MTDAMPKTKKSGPGSRFVAVPAEAIEKRLVEAGFEKGVMGSEIVYRLHHKKCKHLVVCIYTSVSVDGTTARGCGEDAIRVTGIYERQKADGSWFRMGICKPQRVFRTGTVDGVIERMIVRAREAYAACIEHVKDPQRRCWACFGKPRT